VDGVRVPRSTPPPPGVCYPRTASWLGSPDFLALPHGQCIMPNPIFPSLYMALRRSTDGTHTLGAMLPQNSPRQSRLIPDPLAIVFSLNSSKVTLHLREQHKTEVASLSSSADMLVLLTDYLLPIYSYHHYHGDRTSWLSLLQADRSQ
jgi:hypothetical protein